MAATMEQSPAKQIGIAVHEIVDHVRNYTEMKTVAVTPILITADNLDQAERIKEAK